jgi:trehalose/maltose hydrolase-like predicted phosphorylase
LYQDALQSDYVDIQGGTTGEGIHAGVMAGTILITLNTFAGINYREKELHINPTCPILESTSFKLNFKGVHYQFNISKSIEVLSDKRATITLWKNA